MRDTDLTELNSVIEAAAAATRSAAPIRRSRWIGAIADRLDEAADALVPIAQRESHLTDARLRGELTRTTY